MNTKFIKKLKVELSNSEIEALRTTGEILISIENEIDKNDLTSDDLDEVIGNAWCEHYACCAEYIHNLIDEVISIANK